MQDKYIYYSRTVDDYDCWQFYFFCIFLSMENSLQIFTMVVK